MLQKWRDHGAITCAGYILGFPGDTKESILRDIEIIKRELPVDILEFFFLDPPARLGGPQGPLAARGLDGRRPQQIRSQPPRLASFQDVGRGMGRRLSRRLGGVLHARAYPHDPAARRQPIGSACSNSITSTLLWFNTMIPFEGVHPLEGGMIRQKFRRDRRHGLPLESPLVVLSAPIRAKLSARRGYWSVYRRFKTILKEVKAGAGPVDLHRSRHRAAARERKRSARSLSRDQRRRGGARAQAPRRCHPRRDEARSRGCQLS